MFKKILTGAAAAALLATSVAPTAAFAHDRGRHYGHSKHGDARAYKAGYRDGYYRGDRDDGYYRGARYDRGGDRYYRGNSCRDKGTGGLVIGAIAGGLLGNEVARDKTAGTVIGAGVGALAGRAIDKSDSRC